MDITSVIGFIMGLVCVSYILIDGGMTNVLSDKSALVFVLGGTFASTMMTYHWKTFKKIPTGYRLIMFPPKHATPKALINRMCELSGIANQRGVDALPEQLNEHDMPFLKSGVQMLLNDWTVDDIHKHLEQDMQGTLDRHGEVQRMFESMGTYAPVYGLLGTLIGVLGLLKYLGDPTAMGVAMGKAITTFYGIFFANFFALPVAGKLESLSSQEMLLKKIIMEGLVAIKGEINPATLHDKLETIVAQTTRLNKSEVVEA